MLVAKYVPHFLWVIRDFALKLQDSLGRPIDERQYLESALRPVESGQDMDSMKALNEVSVNNVIDTVCNSRLFQK